MSAAHVDQWTGEFNHIDMDGDGSITADEVKQRWTEAKKKFTDADVEAWWKVIDTDGDGRISIDGKFSTLIPLLTRTDYNQFTMA